MAARPSEPQGGSLALEIMDNDASEQRESLIKKGAPNKYTHVLIAEPWSMYLQENMRFFAQFVISGFLLVFAAVMISLKFDPNVFYPMITAVVTYWLPSPIFTPSPAPSTSPPSPPPPPPPPAPVVMDPPAPSPKEDMGDKLESGQGSSILILPPQALPHTVLVPLSDSRSEGKPQDRSLMRELCFQKNVAFFASLVISIYVLVFFSVMVAKQKAPQEVCIPILTSVLGYWMPSPGKPTKSSEAAMGSMGVLA